MPSTVALATFTCGRFGVGGAIKFSEEASSLCVAVSFAREGLGQVISAVLADVLVQVPLSFQV